MDAGRWWSRNALSGVAVVAVWAGLVGCGGADPAEEARDDGADAQPEAADEDKDPDDVPDAEGDEAGGSAWSTTAREYRGREGEAFSYDCPGGASLDDGGAVWGDDPYTDDSAVCMAAVHAGLITPEDGGSVTIEMLPGDDSYDSLDANGVETSSWGEWPGGFTFTDRVAGLDD